MAINQDITNLPTPPNRSDSPSDFSDKADTFLGALPTLQIELNLYADEANATQTQINTSESNAATSESNAASSESAASTSASNAATSESNAATSEQNAQQAATDAETALDNFTDQYLGAKASDPATDNDGDPLQDGALYFNTSDNSIKAYSDSLSSWIVLDVRSDSSIRNLFSASGDLSYNAATGEFSFTETPNYTDADVDAHLSGGTGVTYSTGTISIGQDVGTGADVSFNSVSYDNSVSGLDAINVQDAIDDAVESFVGRKEQIAQGFIQREGTRGDLDVDLAVAIELNLLGAPVAGGFYAGLIDTLTGNIIAADDYQTGLRYALIVSDKSLEGGRGSSPASGLPTGDLRWDTQDRGGEAGCFTRWNGLDATNVIIAKNDTSYEVHDFVEAVRSQYPAATTPGGSEWYLPAMDELELLYRNFKPNNADNDTRDLPRNFPGSNPSGKNLSSVPEGFNYENNPRIPDVTYLDLFKEGNAQAVDLDRYWSTTDADEDGRAWTQNFAKSGFEGIQFAFGKDEPDDSVRPVRRVVL